MRIPSSPEDRIPARAGVDLKAEHYRTIIDTAPDVGFFEVHAENYMGAGGPPHRYLSAIRERYPLSLHGVGLSIGADRPLDQDHIERLRHLRRRYKPGLFSEHLAWSSHDVGFLNDLLPVPYTAETLKRVVEHIDQVQTALGCEMLLENPSTSSRSPRAHTRRRTSSPKWPGAPAAACCSTSTTSSSRRPISNGIRWPTSKVIRSRA